MRRNVVARHALIAGWLLASLAGRVFVPSGFMVDAERGDWPIIACPGQSHGILSVPDHHGERGDHAHETCEADCLSGYAFTFAGEDVATGSSEASLAPSGRADLLEIRAAETRRVDSRRPRGPPSTPPVAV